MTVRQNYGPKGLGEEEQRFINRSNLSWADSTLSSSVAKAAIKLNLFGYLGFRNFIFGVVGNVG